MTGTTVSFENIFELSEHQLKTNIANFLSKEFVWFLQLKVCKNYTFCSLMTFSGSAIHVPCEDRPDILYHGDAGDRGLLCPRLVHRYRVG